MLKLTEIPSDYMRISSGLGSAAPVQVVAYPVFSQETLLAVLELASFRPFQQREQALLNGLLPIIGLSMESLQRLLKATVQAQTLIASETLLRSRASELESMNTRLEEQTRLMEEQAEELERQRQSLQETEAWFRQLVESATLMGLLS